MLFFFGLIYFSFQVTAVANDRFGRLLSAGITTYLAMHMIVNMGMMCGFLAYYWGSTYADYLWWLFGPFDDDRFGNIAKYL